MELEVNGGSNLDGDETDLESKVNAFAVDAGLFTSAQNKQQQNCKRDPSNTIK